MTVFVRTSLRLFALANPLYIGATVTFYDVDANGVRLATKPTLYAGPTGTSTLGNPQTLDSDGKLAQPVYHEVEMAAVITQAAIDDHTTGVIRPNEVNDSQTLSYPGDPNGNVAAAFVGVDVWDTVSRLRWVASTAGTATTAVWEIDYSPRYVYDVTAPPYNASRDGTTDDSTAIQDAIDDAKTAGGGVVYLPVGIYAIAAQLLVDSPNIMIRGDGGDRSHSVGILLDQATTILKWTGTSGATMVKYTSPIGAGNQIMHGGGLIGVAFDANSQLADNGLLVESRQNGIFKDLYFNEFDGVCLDINVVSLLGESTSCQRCIFQNISTRSAAAGNGIGIRLGGSGGNPSFLYFQTIDIRHQNGVGMEIGNADNNLFENVRIFRGAGGTGIGLELKAAATVLESCRANLFVHLNCSNGGVTARGTPSGTVASQDNTIIFYDKDNASPDPVIETDAELYWHATDGVWRDMQVQQMALSETVVGSLTAREALGNNIALMVVNDNEGHIHLRDNAGGDWWRIFINSTNGNLQFNRIAGTGGFVIPGNAASPLFLGTIEVFQNAGTPEGSIAAPVGSLCLNTNGGASTTAYLKESGAGNTGWKAITTAV